MFDFDPLEAIYVVGLFGGYLSLWNIKRWQQRKETGQDPEVMGKGTDRLQQYFSDVTQVLRGLVVLLIVIHLALSSDGWGLRRLPMLDHRWIDHLGLTLGIAGLTVCRIAQATMGKAWRVGLDEERHEALVTQGIYRHIRNPTYLGLFLVNGGFWLIWPTCMVAMFVITFVFFLEVQVRCEEQYLLEIHGQAYEQYLTKSKRYVPGVWSLGRIELES